MKAQNKANGKLKAKRPTSPRTISGLWLELIFFLALALLGFSLVQTLILPQGGLGINFELPVLGLSAVDKVSAAGLYEAPSNREQPELDLSPIFTPSVQYWKNDLIAWAADYDLDPNLAATVMQIESCGYPNANSIVGAKGLFQVMPFHFEEGDEMLDPDTNAAHGLAYFATGLNLADGHAGLALAGYNGGHNLIDRAYETWPLESQRYYRWGGGIYREASAGWDSSPTLAAWLAAGGQSLCDTAESYLGLVEENAQ